MGLDNGLATICQQHTRMAARSEVIACFRRLHRTRAKIFQGDSTSLAAAREKINSEFRKFKKITNTETVAELVKYGNQAEEILRTSVIQAEVKDQNTMALKISKETAMFDNIIYKG